MNIKSLLLGSAAAFVAVSGARAADAVVIAEPEPMEYVRICDTYGAGFYYIPGTETCLKISGYAQYDIGVGDLWSLTSLDKADWIEDDVYDLNDTYYKRARFSLRVDARSETELGTLRAFAELLFNHTSVDAYLDAANEEYVENWSNTASSFSFGHAYFQLGGLLVGATDSLYNTFIGFSGNIVNDDFVVSYGADFTNQINYTFDAGNGFRAAIGLEEGNGEDYTIDSYMPHVVGGVGYTAGWGGINAVIGYDSIYEELAGKLRVDFNASDALSLFAWVGISDGDATDNFYSGWEGDWGIVGGGSFQANDKLTVNLQLAYDDAENFGAAFGVNYELVDNFVVTPEVYYGDNFDDDGDGEWGGWLRMRASFGG